MYKLDLFKSDNRLDGDLDSVNKQRPSSHVNFFNPDSVNTLFDETELEIISVCGLDYKNGLPYLVWLNGAYITNMSTLEKLKRLVRMFNSEYFDNYINSMEDQVFKSLFENETYKLQSLVRMFEGFTESSDIPEKETKIKTKYSKIVEQLKIACKGLEIDDTLYGKIIESVKSTPKTYMANSVILIAEKRTHAQT